jgi:adenine-specific DNA-methyltransferase
MVGALRQTLTVSSPVALDTATVRKSRGAFFTPPPIARYITDWAVRTVTDRVLEPSCGEAAFLLAAVDRLKVLQEASTSAMPPHLDGVELHEASARAARSVLREAGVDAEVTVGDFFTVDPTGTYDTVIGNPPYVRFQDFSGESRARSHAAALRAGVRLTGLASSWAAFTVHSALFLKRGGRLGLVLPAELLTVNYAADIRRFLMQRFAHVDLVLFEERVFPGVMEEVVLLLAEGFDEGPTDQCRIYQARDAESLKGLTVPSVWKPASPESKWTGSLLSTHSLNSYSGLDDSAAFSTLEDWGDTTLGMVSGNNKFFALTPARLTELRLEEGDLIRLCPPGSRHLRTLSFTQSAWASMGDQGSPTWLFRPGLDPSRPALEYISKGEELEVDQAYKCRVRKPWWRTPLVPPAHLFLTYMNADTPRLCANRARVHNLNSVHGLYLKAGLRMIGMNLLPIAALNSMTLLGAERVGRAYGGGMLKVEPKEADRLPVPSPAIVAAAGKDLSALRPALARLLSAGRLLDAVRLVDDVLLVGHMGQTISDVESLRQGHSAMMARRTARGRSA